MILWESLDSRESFQGSRTEPLFCESHVRGLKIANRRFEAIRANPPHVTKIGVFLRIDSRESIHANRRDSRCESPGRLINLRTLCGFQKVLRRPVPGFPCTGCTETLFLQGNFRGFPYSGYTETLSNLKTRGGLGYCRDLASRKRCNFLATGKYGCTEVRVYPTECGEQLGTDP